MYKDNIFCWNITSFNLCFIRKWKGILFFLNLLIYSPQLLNLLLLLQEPLSEGLDGRIQRITNGSSTLRKFYETSIYHLVRKFKLTLSIFIYTQHELVKWSRTVWQLKRWFPLYLQLDINVLVPSVMTIDKRYHPHTN